MNKKLNDKIIVVTGAGGTLCSEMARDLAMQGAKVALIGRNLEKLKKVDFNIIRKDVERFLEDKNELKLLEYNTIIKMI